VRFLLALLLAATVAQAGDPWWNEKTLDLFARLPVQDGGRTKPLSTVFSFALLRINHQRSFKDADGNKRSSLEWGLSVLFHPESARRENVFLVENHDVLDAIGLAHEGHKRRDRYTYEDLLPARDRLLSLGHDYSALEASQRNPVQGQLVHLAHNFMEFERLLHFLDFARVGGAVEALASLRQGGPGGDALKEELSRAFGGALALALLPPTDGSDEWLTPRDVAEMALRDMPVAPEHLEMLGILEDLVRSRDEPGVFEQAAAALEARSRKLAEPLGSYGKIGLEVSFYRLDPFYRSLTIFLGAFLLVALGWLRPNKWFAWGASGLAWSGVGLTIAGIVLRCILRGRPPVSTLYETVIFITAVGVLAALVMEIINRRRIGLAAAPILGALGLFVAGRFEEINREDTMPQLVAVLDTNFWLATHVTCITIGYAAGLLAAAIAHVHLFGRALGWKRDDTSFYRGVTRMVYGVTCFSLIFSVVGTILGGVWANESWGRFWGWDPKENGALLIVLAQLALLHGRMGGYLRDLGVCMAAVGTGCVVAWSWWGVNLLGVGLHSYGFTEGVWNGLIAFGGVEAVTLGVGFVGWLRIRKPK
jgi:ABC-type transport system involved in cytochrome c biogenesis permease subunit